MARDVAVAHCANVHELVAAIHWQRTSSSHRLIVVDARHGLLTHASVPAGFVWFHMQLTSQSAWLKKEPHVTKHCERVGDQRQMAGSHASCVVDALHGS